MSSWLNLKYSIFVILHMLIYQLPSRILLTTSNGIGWTITEQHFYPSYTIFTGSLFHLQALCMLIHHFQWHPQVKLHNLLSQVVMLLLLLAQEKRRLRWALLANAAAHAPLTVTP